MLYDNATFTCNLDQGIIYSIKALKDSIYKVSWEVNGHKFSDNYNESTVNEYFRKGDWKLTTPIPEPDRSQIKYDLDGIKFKCTIGGYEDTVYSISRTPRNYKVSWARNGIRSESDIYSESCIRTKFQNGSWIILKNIRTRCNVCRDAI